MSRESRGLIHVLRELGLDPKAGIEVGVFRGRTSAALLRHFPQLRLAMIDQWAPPPRDSSYARSGDSKAKIDAKRWEKIEREAWDRTMFAGDRRMVVKGDLFEVHRVFKDWRYDFVFLDADHSYAGTRRAIALWRTKVRAGGVLAGDDYVDRRGYGVIRAVDELVGECSSWFHRSGNVWGVRL